MSFPYNAYLAAALSAAVVTFLSLPFWRRWCFETGHVDDPGHRKIHSSPVPLAGGLAVFTGLLVPLIAAVIFLWASSPAAAFPTIPPSDGQPAELLGYGIARRLVPLCAILGGAVGILLLGWMDDKYELRPATKFMGQLAVCLVVAAAGVRITLFVPNLLFSYFVTILWMLTIINSVNFIDNMNGLCTGLSVIASLIFGCLAAENGQYLVASMAFLAGGGFLGFLPYNFPKAKAFLGDAGSHLAGYILSVLAILPAFYNPEDPRRWRVLTPLLVLAVPLIDIVRVVALRTLAGKPFYVGDTNHLSHWLVRKGLSRHGAVLVLWLVAALAGAVTLLK